MSENSENNNINLDTPIRKISDMYQDWFLDYASYVILERAVPNMDDGLKPVQRRILHSMKNIHDSRYHKVANIIGHTMQYHPHGDQAIGDALVALGQKDLLIDPQGNWGDVRTGDKAAAPRYIEARLTPFALEVLYNKNITKFQKSYDGRNNEPKFLPAKFPLLLAQGAEGIAVGLSTKILPHNFNDLVKASISILKDKPFTIYPDFHNGGMIDITNYNNGKKGGKVRVRSNIEIVDKETLSIKDLSYGVTTTSLIDSIVKANNSNKIKIKNIEDNTAEDVEIIIHLIKGVSPTVTIDALYAFTNCEVSISPNCCVIIDNKPEFISVNNLLRLSTARTKNILKSELNYNLILLKDKLHYLTLESIFIENKIYRKIEDCNTWESILEVIDQCLKPFKEELIREYSKEDLEKLVEIKIKKITKYDKIKHLSSIDKIKNDIDEIKNNISNLNDYTIRYFKHLRKTYGEKYFRRTQIETFDSISARRVIVANKKLYVNKEDGFIGFGLKQSEFVSKCSELDNVIVFLKNGNYIITKVEDKKYVGEDILHVGIWKKNDVHMVYNLVYKDLLNNISYVKRFSVTKIVKDKIYKISKNNSQILYLTANPNSESEIVDVFLHYKSKAKKKNFSYDFSILSIKSRHSKGNILSKHNIRKIDRKSIGESTLGGREIYLDENIGKLNTESRGVYLGSFNSDDSIIIFYKDGTYEMTSFDLSNRYKMSDIYILEKLNSEIVYSAVHQDGKTKKIYIKRFQIDTQMLTKRHCFITENRGSKILSICNYHFSDIEYSYRNARGDKKTKRLNVNDFIDIKGYKALGKILDNKKRMSGFNFIKLDVVEDADSKIVDGDEVNIKASNNNEDTELTLF